MLCTALNMPKVQQMSWLSLNLHLNSMIGSILTCQEMLSKSEIEMFQHVCASAEDDYLLML